jgi:hypothetical protein
MARPARPPSEIEAINARYRYKISKRRFDQYAWASLAALLAACAGAEFGFVRVTVGCAVAQMALLGAAYLYKAKAGRDLDIVEAYDRLPKEPVMSNAGDLLFRDVQ